MKKNLRINVTSNTLGRATNGCVFIIHVKLLYLVIIMMGESNIQCVHKKISLTPVVCDQKSKMRATELLMTF